MLVALAAIATVALIPLSFQEAQAVGQVHLFDEFNGPLLPPGGTDCTFTTGDGDDNPGVEVDGGIQGGERDCFVEKIGGTGLTMGDVDEALGIYVCNNDANTQGQCTVSYDGVGSPGLNLDISLVDNFLLYPQDRLNRTQVVRE